MSGRWPLLSAAALSALAGAAERGRLTAPFGVMQVGRYVAEGEREDAQRLLEGLSAAGLSGEGMAAALRLAEEARRAGEERPRPVLVWSDLDMRGSRDTRVVCEELFREARVSVLVSTFSWGHWAGEGEAKGNPVFWPLAKRMEQIPGLRVRLFVNLRRRKQDGVRIEEVERGFWRLFRRSIWPWEPVPDVYYDPRALEAEENACLHAKCVVVDDARAFVSSANLTEAAQLRNIEAGVLLEDAVFAKALRMQFDGLVEKGYVRRVKVEG